MDLMGEGNNTRFAISLTETKNSTNTHHKVYVNIITVKDKKTGYSISICYTYTLIYKYTNHICHANKHTSINPR